MYQAYITRIKNVEKHSNADALQIGQCFGNNVIVDMSTQDNELGVYFPVDGKLGVEFATVNNLIRMKDEQGNNIGGYLDPERRNIRALKLRGAQSDGLFMPLKSLETFTDINKLKEGDTIDILNKVLICEKYIPRAKTASSGQGSNKQKGSKKAYARLFPLFEEHKDTAQIMYNLSAFKEGDIITTSLKMHGCFKFDTKVRLWGEKRAKNISRINIGDIVVGYKDGEIVPSKVINIFQNGKTKDWIKLQITRKGYAGEEYQNIVCTPEHLFWDNTNQKWVEAQSLSEGSIIYTIVDSYQLSKTQKEILVGKFLGDGSYHVRNSADIVFSHKKLHEDYVYYMLKILGDVSYLDKTEYTSGYGTTMVRGKTIECNDIKQYFDNFILSKDSENKLSETIIDEFTELSLAILYMDDGNLSHSDKQIDRASFAICSYNNHDANIIVKCFEKLGLEPKLYNDKSGYNRIRLNYESAYKMFEMIKKYIPNVMQYKLPEELRDYTKEEFSHNDFGTFGYNFIENTVYSNQPYEAKTNHIKYDLETETHNYVVGNNLVHNSSGRTTYTPKEDTRHKLLQKFFPKQPKYEHVSGSRRVVLDFSKDNADGYYNDNTFRKKWHDIISPRLHKGETIYYEIVGWVAENTLIMPECQNKKVQDKEFTKQYGATTQFTYGCERGENVVYVYRMTLTNEDGFVVEYPTWKVQQRCEEMGLNFVPVFERFIFTTEEDLLRRVDGYLEGADPIGKTHTREGVVARIENRNTFTAYKKKSWFFKCIEGLIKDEAVVADIEEIQEN